MTADVTVESGPEGEARVRLTGELDLVSSRAVRDAIARAGQHGEHVVIDLTDVSFIDASGVSALVQGMRSVFGCGGACELLHPQAAVRRVFDLLGYPEYLG
jgi:anti-anti-sigma factor